MIQGLENVDVKTIISYIRNKKIEHEDSVAQWIRRWSTEPEILGLIPSGVDVSLF
jgi:hypothetical protein